MDFPDKIATSNPALHDKREKLVIKKNRRNIHKFERTYGLIAKILGLANPVGFRENVDESSDNAPQGEESSSTLETKVKGKVTAQPVKPSESSTSQPKKWVTKDAVIPLAKSSCGKHNIARVVKKDVTAYQPKKKRGESC